MKSAEDYMRGAFAALLRGDTDERDRLCRQAALLMAARDRLDAGRPLAEGAAIRLPDRSNETFN